MASLVTREGAHAQEFSLESQRRILSISFWEVKHPVCMPDAQCGGDVPLSTSFAVLTSQFLSAMGGDVTLICCGEAKHGFIKALDKSPGRKGDI